MIQYPHELFEHLPSHEADALRASLSELYFKAHPDEMNAIVAKSEGDPMLVESFKDEKVTSVVAQEYGFSMDILEQRDSDSVAKLLVQEMNKFNAAEKGIDPVTGNPPGGTQNK